MSLVQLDRIDSSYSQMRLGVVLNEAQRSEESREYSIGLHHRRLLDSLLLRMTQFVSNYRICKSDLYIREALQHSLLPHIHLYRDCD